MKKIHFILISIMMCVTTLTGCASMNADGTEDSINAFENGNNAEIGSDKRIISTSVAICEILDDLGYENVVGVPETSSQLPERYADLPLVGAPMNPDYEIIKTLSPDLVLSPKSLESSLSDDYISAGINCAFLDLSSVDGMYKAISSLGDLLGCTAQADKLIGDYNEYMDAYNAEANENQPSILLLMSFPDGFYLVSTENSYVGNLVELAGGKNVYGKDYEGDENGFVNINAEDMVQKEPDMILVYAHYGEESAFAFMENEFATNPAWQYYDAVTEGNIHYLPYKYFGMSATLSWTDALDFLKPIIHGE